MVVLGIDEVGRGALAGPVVVAGVALEVSQTISGVRDSKCLTRKQRESLYDTIRTQSLEVIIAESSVEEIETLNILGATLLAMQRVVSSSTYPYDVILIDGTVLPVLQNLSVARAIPKGDSTVPAISAASIVAKVFRDNKMTQYHHDFPHYAFSKHMGYPTAFHCAALERHGPCSIHRKTFAPISRLLAKH